MWSNLSVTCDRSVDFPEYSNFRHKSSSWNIFKSWTPNLQWTNDGSKFVYVVHNTKHLWVIMWHIFTSTNNTTTILFPTQLWELLYTYHVIKQCTEKETTSLSYHRFYGKDCFSNIKTSSKRLEYLNIFPSFFKIFNTSWNQKNTLTVFVFYLF
jgi:hypothetical protein